MISTLARVKCGKGQTCYLRFIARRPRRRFAGFVFGRGGSTGIVKRSSTIAR
jgi:hypothetical protein